MNKPLKPIPKFASEAEERAFWETPDNDSTAYLDWSKAKRAVFPNLKPSTQAISLRLPVSLLSAIKVRANRMDVPYQSLIKTWLAENAAETDQRWAGRSHQNMRSLCSRTRLSGKPKCRSPE